MVRSALLTLLLLVIGFSTPTGGVANCPAVCQCVSTLIDCKEPGLDVLPMPPSSKLEMVIIANQTFRRSVLDRAALRPYWTPEHGGQVRLRLLKIRNCNIVSLASDAFANLGSQLEELDLSGNPLHTIEAHTFTGLRLKSLFLNNLQNPVINDQAFSSVDEVGSLSIQNSRLTSLPLQPLMELVNSRGLKSLSLRDNQISHLSPAFENSFRILQSLELSDNPWICDCKLQWLIQLHKLNLVAKRSGSVPNLSEGSRGDVRQPLCFSPPEFAGYTFDQVALNESELYHHAPMPKRPSLNCEMPRVEHIEVDLRPDSLSDLVDTNLAKIVCQMRGVTESGVSWIYHPEVGDSRDVTVLSKQEFGNPIPYPFVPPQQKLLSSWLSVKQVSETDMYSCRGHNILGNTSMTVRIRWPQRKPFSPQEELGLHGGGTGKVSNHDSADVVAGQRSEFGVLAKRFSLMDVIGAVLGTFLVTMLLFVIVYRSSKLYVYRRSKLRDQSDAIMRHQDGTKPAGDGTSSSGAASSLLKFSQLPRYPPEYTQAPVVQVPYQHQQQGGLILAQKQHDSGTFNSHSTTSSQAANGLGAYETVYNEPTNNPLMYETPGENVATTSAPLTQQSFLFQITQPPALAGYPLMFGGTLPSHSSAAYALGMGNHNAQTYLPPPPTGQQPSLPRSIQSQSGPSHLYSPTIPISEHYTNGGIAVSIQTPATSATQR